jgi:hypothetical protein
MEEETLAAESAAAGETTPAAVEPERKEETLEEVLARHRSVATFLPRGLLWIGAIQLVPSRLELCRVVRLARRGKMLVLVVFFIGLLIGNSSRKGSILSFAVGVVDYRLSGI